MRKLWIKGMHKGRRSERLGSHSSGLYRALKWVTYSQFYTNASMQFYTNARVHCVNTNAGGLTLMNYKFFCFHVRLLY